MTCQGAELGQGDSEIASPWAGRPSPDGGGQQYKVRVIDGFPPPEDESDDETIIASQAANVEFLTDAGLLAPGDRSLFKVYPINADDRGNGSNVVDVTRPA